ncbi:MAG: hypothetical protein NTW95_02715 [Candidatus Aminicenantes bacterium]|nr:hypothetical protein [Candidatus Aminicenantes bacterium]
MKPYSRISLYLLAAAGMLNFFSPSFPAWPFARLLPWIVCLTAAFFVLAFEAWRCRASILRYFRDRRRAAGMALVAVLAVLVLRLFMPLFPLAMLDADTEEPVEVARRIASDGARPVYIFNQFYQGVAVSYLYVAAAELTGKLHTSVQLVNILLIAAGVFFLALFWRRLGGDWLVWILLAASLFESMQLLATVTVRGFALVFCLLAYLILQMHGIICENRRTFFRTGAAAGLLFFQYQPALLFAALLLVAVIFSRFHRGDAPEAAGTIGAGFILGAGPHLLAEAYNGFINTTSIFLSKSGGILARIADPVNIGRHFLYHPAQIEPEITAWIFWSLFAAGFALCLWLGLKKKHRAALLPPLLYLAAVLVSALSGVAPDDARFSAHFRIYTPLALLVVAAPFCLGAVLRKKWTRVVVVVAILAWNGLRFESDWRTYHRFHGYSRQVVKLLNRSPALLFFGEYWFARRFCAALAPGKTVLSASSFIKPEFYRSPGQFLPDYLTAAENWPHLAKGYLAMARNAERLVVLLDRLGFRFRRSHAGAVVLFDRFRPDPTPDLLHHLALAELLSDMSVQRLLPSTTLLPIVRRNAGRLAVDIPLAADDLAGRRLILKRGGFVLSWPPLAADLPVGAAVDAGNWTLYFSWKSVPLCSGTASLAAPAMVETPLLRLDLGDRRRLYFLPGRRGRRDPETTLRPLGPSERLYSGTDHAAEASGAVIGDGLRIAVLDSRIRCLRLDFLSPLDFDSLAWTKRFKQSLRVSADGSPRPAIPLAVGANSVLIAVCPGSTIVLQAEHRSFFAAADAAGGVELVRTGLLLRKITCLDSSRRKLGDILPFLSVSEKSD